MSAFSVLTQLTGRHEQHPACKSWLMRCWCGCLSGERCRLFAYSPADATVSPKPHCLLRHLNPDWFYLSGTGVVVTWKCIQCLEFSLGIAEKSSKCRNFCTHTHDRVTALFPRLPGWAEQKGTFTNSHPWGGRRRMRTDNKVHCVGAHPLYVALSQRGC